MKTLLLFLFVFSTQLISAQFVNEALKKKDTLFLDCDSLFNQFEAYIDSENYSEAINIWTNKYYKYCEVDYVDYYLATIAFSELNKKDSALMFLSMALLNDFDELDWLKNDERLTNIRDTKRFKVIVEFFEKKEAEKLEIQRKEKILLEKERKERIRKEIEKKELEKKEKKIKAIEWIKQFDVINAPKFQFLTKFFSKLNPLKLEEVIPFCKNKKWGYINKMGVSLVKPIFQFTDFSSYQGLLFKYEGNYFFYNKTGNINKLILNNQTVGSITGESGYNNNFKQNNLPGFIIIDGQIVSHNEKYARICLINKEEYPFSKYATYLGEKDWAIVRNEQYLFAIIDKDGAPLNEAFNFKYKIDDYDFTPPINYYVGDQVFFKLQTSNSETLIIDLKGQELTTNKSVEKIGYFNYYYDLFWDNNFQIHNESNSNKCKFIKLRYSDGTENLIVDKNNKVNLKFSKVYSSILLSNGVCSTKFNGSQAGKFYSKELTTIYYLVKENNDFFYVDDKGNEYKVKE